MFDCIVWKAEGEFETYTEKDGTTVRPLCPGYPVYRAKVRGKGVYFNLEVFQNTKDYSKYSWRIRDRRLNMYQSEKAFTEPQDAMEDVEISAKDLTECGIKYVHRNMKSMQILGG